MTKLTKAQIATFEKQNEAIDKIFRDVAAILSKPLDKKSRHKLVQVNNFLHKAGKVLSSIHSEEDEEEGDDAE